MLWVSGLVWATEVDALSGAALVCAAGVAELQANATAHSSVSVITSMLSFEFEIVNMFIPT